MSCEAARSTIRGRSRLAAPLSVPGPKAGRAAEHLGLRTVGDLLEHLPRDRREARAVAELVPGETRDGGGRGALDLLALGAPPRNAAAGRGGGGRRHGPMKATFFNQPWLVERYPPGTRLVLHGKLPGATGSPSRRTPVPPRRWPAATRSPTIRPPKGSPRPRSWLWCASTPARCRTWSSRCRRGCGAASGCPTAPPRSPPRTSPPTRPTLEAGRRRLAFEELLLAQLALLRRRRDARGGVAGARAGRPRAS